MKKYIVVGQNAAVHSGILRLTPEQAATRMQGIPERLEPLKAPDCYRVLRTVYFKNGETFYYEGDRLNRDFQEVTETGVLQEAVELLGRLTEKVLPEKRTEEAQGLMPALPDAGAQEDMPAKDLFERLGLSFMHGKSMLKKQYGFDVQNGQSVVPGDIVGQVLAS